MTRITSEGSNTWPIWTPDGRHVTFHAQRASNSGIYQAPADGSGKPELLLAEAPALPGAWTRDSQTLLYTGRGPDGKGHIWMLPAPRRGSEGKPRPFFHPDSESSRTLRTSVVWAARKARISKLFLRVAER